MNFSSQICTTKEQSERLLALGLKKETADMYYPNGVQDSGHIVRAIYPAFWDSDRKIDGLIRGRVTPAWSLHRLIEIHESFRASRTDCWDNPYEAMISRIANKIKRRELNKEYLEE